MVKNNIKELRQQANLSQEQLANKAGVSVRTIQRLESGNDGSIETLNLVAGALNVTVRDLFPAEGSDNDKLQSAANQLQYQLQNRQNEYRNFKHIYTAVFIIIMLVWGTLLSVINNDTWATIVGILWIGAWVLMAPLKRLIVMKEVDPSLDKKYPLTKSNPHKDVATK